MVGVFHGYVSHNQMEITTMGIPSGKRLQKNDGKIHHAINGKTMGKPLENGDLYGKIHRSTMLFMGKLTISTGPLSIANCMFTRDWCHKHQRSVITCDFCLFSVLN